ncbi:MAG: Fur family transcriptional regulator [Elainellaceae cyanobacterium]
MSNSRSTQRTPAQDAVLAALEHHHQPLSAQELHSEMRRSLTQSSKKGQIGPQRPSQRKIGLATVYRSLDALQKAGLIQHRITLEGETLYSVVKHDNHCMTCLHCGQSLPVDACPVTELEEKLRHSSAFKVYYHTLEFFGLCESCAHQQP